jgi:hypothetical protein
MDRQFQAFATYLKAPWEEFFDPAATWYVNNVPRDRPASLEGVRLELERLHAGDRGLWVKVLSAVIDRPDAAECLEALRPLSPFDDRSVVRAEIKDGAIVVRGDVGDALDTLKDLAAHRAGDFLAIRPRRRLKRGKCKIED